MKQGLDYSLLGKGVGEVKLASVRAEFQNNVVGLKYFSSQLWY